MVDLGKQLDQTAKVHDLVHRNNNIPVFLKRGVLAKTRKAPARRPRHRRPSLFLPHINKCEFQSSNKEKYPTQNDATDDIYPMGLPKPCFCYWEV